MLLQVQCKVFSTTFNPEGLRLGNKVLRQRLRGPALASYYPRKVVTLRDLQKKFPDLETFDEKEEDRLEHLTMLVLAQRLMLQWMGANRLVVSKLGGRERPRRRRRRPVGSPSTVHLRWRLTVCRWQAWQKKVKPQWCVGPVYYCMKALLAFMWARHGHITVINYLETMAISQSVCSFPLSDLVTVMHLSGNPNG